MTSNVIDRLEQRALLAEQMIDQLNKQISQLQMVAVGMRKDQLRKENEDLRKEVENLKNRLVTVESAHNISQYYDFSKRTNLSNGNVVPTVQIPLPPASTEVKTPATNITSVPENIETSSKKEKKSKKGEKGSDGGNKKGSSGGKAPEPELPIDVARLDFRVGCIVSATKHPDAESLYVEQVDVGEEKMRTVVSGLVRFVPLEEMQNRMAVLLCNLKPAKMRGITSEAMVMCASTPEKVEILIPPETSKPGDVVEFEGYVRNPDSILNPKKKVFETCAPDLITNDQKVATYKSIPFTVPGKGTVVAATLANVQIK